MKKLLTLIAILVVILSVASPVLAQDGPTTPDRPEGTATTLYLPLVTRLSPSYLLTGQIKDAQDLPVSGATVSTEFGQVGVTDVNGVYQMNAPVGQRHIVAAKDGYDFEPGVADLNVSANMNNLNFTAVSKADQISLAACTQLLLNPALDSGVAGWTIHNPGNNHPAAFTQEFWYSPVWSMLTGWSLSTTNTFLNQYTTGEFYQSVTIPATADTVRLQFRVLPRSADWWGYHIEEQAAMDAAMDPNAPDATEAQYAQIVSSTDIDDTIHQMFKWFPINSYYWLYRSYDLTNLGGAHLDLRGDTISVLFGATDWGDGYNTGMYVDEVYLYYCVP
ncbi:MAG: hypothetical protein A2W35_21135 [Chloroflexi bacterium RBG_16_57_11]|nr:MAG: hypothetical protein A2W35_21135 [Chloroflexi bacterium RBG_16_57_11]